MSLVSFRRFSQQRVVFVTDGCVCSTVNYATRLCTTLRGAGERRCADEEEGGRIIPSSPPPPSSYVSFAAAPGFSQAPKRTLGRPPSEVPETQVQCYVIPDVVTEEAEQALLRFTTPWFQRLPFADGHMDSLIHHYKEFYRPFDAMLQDDSMFDEQPSSTSTSDGSLRSGGSILRETHREREMELVREALSACRGLAAEYLPHIPLQNRVHFLQLHGDGFIRAHVDESRNSSGIVAGLALNTGRVMSLTNKRFPGARIDLLMAPRAMYMLCGAARHEWEHSVDWTEDDEEHMKRIHKSHVAEGSEVIFNGKPSGFRRGTRTAVIFRGVSPMELLMQRMGAKHRHA